MRPHSPPSCCRRCGEPHYIGWRHVCVDVHFVQGRVQPEARFTLTDPTTHEGPWPDLNWVMAERMFRQFVPGISTQQIYDILQRAKERAENG